MFLHPPESTGLLFLQTGACKVEHSGLHLHKQGLLLERPELNL